MLEVIGLHKRFGSQSVLRGVNLFLACGEVACLLGASGQGKTTLLRVIAGFEDFTEGQVILNGQLLSANCSASERGLGFLFQNYALFPHMTVTENIGFALLSSPLDTAERTAEVLKLCDIREVKNQYPNQLSGGQQQRVALARALAPKPALLLMDEPFSNLDPGLRMRVRSEVKILLKKLGQTALIVTHNIEEAYDLGDKIGILEGGKMKQWDTPYNLYHCPKDRYVAQFIDQGRIVDAKVDSDSWLWLGEEKIAIIDEIPPRSGRVHLLVRPDDVIHDEKSPLKAKVVQKSFRGSSFLYELELASYHRVLSLVPSHYDHAVGEKIGIKFDFDHVVWFPVDTIT